MAVRLSDGSFTETVDEVVVAAGAHSKPRQRGAGWRGGEAMRGAEGVGEGASGAGDDERGVRSTPRSAMDVELLVGEQEMEHLKRSLSAATISPQQAPGPKRRKPRTPPRPKHRRRQRPELDSSHSAAKMLRHCVLDGS